MNQTASSVQTAISKLDNSLTFPVASRVLDKKPMIYVPQALVPGHKGQLTIWLANS